MKKILDVLNLLLVLLAIALAGRLWFEERAGVALLPLLAPGDPPGQLFGEGGAERVLQSRLATLGDRVSVEDLVRGALALEKGSLPGVKPLTDDERATIRALLQEAETHREELMKVEQEITANEAELRQIAREMATQLTPAQRAWVLEQRSSTSVGGIEAAYWAELSKLLEAP